MYGWMVWAFAELIVTHSHAVLNQQKSFYCTCLHKSTANLIEDEKSDISYFKSFGNFNLHSLFFPIYSKSTSLYYMVADEEINKDNKWYELHALQQKCAIKNTILHSMYTYKSH